MALQIIRSILLGLIPEVLFFTFSLVIILGIREKKKVLGILIGIEYIICMFIQRYECVYYIVFVLLIYLTLLVLYKKVVKITDSFIIGLLLAYVCIAGVISAIFINDNLENYYICLIFSRILLVIPFLFKNKFRVLYEKYCKLWNRNDLEKRPIKSITLRGLSLILLNVLIYCIYLATKSIINI